MSNGETLENVFELYQKFTPTTALYPGTGTGNTSEVLYLSLGLMGEFVEWCESGYDLKEAGDLFWYSSQLCNVFKWDLYDVYMDAVAQYRYKQPNLAELLKKHLRDGKNISEDIKDYVSFVLSYMKTKYSYSMNNPALAETVQYILITNRDKLIDRQNRNVLHGDGDNR